MARDDVILVSRADIARYAGVGRAAVTNWQGRHNDFPRPVPRDGAELFDAVAVAAWLDTRKVPANMLVAGETDGQHYGNRFRRNLGLAPAPDSTPAGPRMSSSGRAVLRLMDSVRGQLPPEQQVAALAPLIYLRARHPQIWADLKVRSGQEGGWHLLDDAWRRAMHEEPGGHIPLPARPSDTSSIDSWLIGPTMHAVDEAHHQLEHASPPPTRRPPSAELFVRLVEEYIQMQGRRSQEFFTPRSVAKLAADLLNPSSSALRIYDPFCRGGEFLDEVVSRCPGIRRARLQGRHPRQDLCSLAQMNLRLHGVEPQIGTGYWWDPWVQPEQYDLVLTNPPFNLRLPLSAVLDRSWRYGQPPVHNGNFAWLQHIISALAPGGRAAVVMPNNAGVSTNPRERTIRTAMIEDGAVECVIALPARLFPGTGIPVSLWLLRDPPGTAVDVLFVDATQLGTSAARGTRALADEDVDRIVAVRTQWLRGEQVNVAKLARSVPITEIRTCDHALNPPTYVVSHEPPRDMSADRAQVADLLHQSSELKQRVRDLDEEIRKLTTFLDDAREPRKRWPTTPLGRLCTLKAGPSGRHLRGGHQHDDGVPILLPRHIQDGYIADDDEVSVPVEVAQRLSGYRLKVDDLVCTRTGELGRVAKVAWQQQDWLFSTGLIRLRTGVEVLPSYLACVLASRASRVWITRHATGTVVPAITLNTLARLPVPVPALAEQRQIGAALDAIAEQERIHTQLASATQSVRNALTLALFDGQVST